MLASHSVLNTGCPHFRGPEYRVSKFQGSRTQGVHISGVQNTGCPHFRGPEYRVSTIQGSRLEGILHQTDAIYCNGPYAATLMHTSRGLGAEFYEHHILQHAKRQIYTY